MNTYNDLPSTDALGNSITYQEFDVNSFFDLIEMANVSLLDLMAVSTILIVIMVKALALMDFPNMLRF